MSKSLHMHALLLCGTVLLLHNLLLAANAAPTPATCIRANTPTTVALDGCSITLPSDGMLDLTNAGPSAAPVRSVVNSVVAGPVVLVVRGAALRSTTALPATVLIAKNTFTDSGIRIEGWVPVGSNITIADNTGTVNRLNGVAPTTNPAALLYQQVFQFASFVSLWGVSSQDTDINIWRNTFYPTNELLVMGYEFAFVNIYANSTSAFAAIGAGGLSIRGNIVLPWAGGLPASLQALVRIECEGGTAPTATPMVFGAGSKGLAIVKNTFSVHHEVLPLRPYKGLALLALYGNVKFVDSVLSIRENNYVAYGTRDVHAVLADASGASSGGLLTVTGNRAQFLFDCNTVIVRKTGANASFQVHGPGISLLNLAAYSVSYNAFFLTDTSVVLGGLRSNGLVAIRKNRVVESTVALTTAVAILSIAQLSCVGCAVVLDGNSLQQPGAASRTLPFMSLDARFTKTIVSIPAVYLRNTDATFAQAVTGPLPPLIVRSCTSPSGCAATTTFIACLNKYNGRLLLTPVDYAAVTDSTKVIIAAGPSGNVFVCPEPADARVSGLPGCFNTLTAPTGPAAQGVVAGTSGGKSGSDQSTTNGISSDLRASSLGALVGGCALVVAALVGVVAATRRFRRDAPSEGETDSAAVSSADVMMMAGNTA